jgi:uncharacterized membrane protein
MNGGGGFRAGSVLAGFVTGLRSQMMLAVMTRAAQNGTLAVADGSPVTWLRSPLLGKLTQVSAICELAADKLPTIPNRIDPAPLSGRLFFGALSAGTLASATGRNVVIGVAGGAAGAAAGSFAGYWVRTRSVKKTGLPDIAVGLTEDAIAIGLARFTVQCAARPDISQRA